LESFWAIHKGYRKAAGKCHNTCCQPIEEEAELPSGCQQKCDNFGSFPLHSFISVEIIKKSKMH
jgi:hypothetical protein